MKLKLYIVYYLILFRWHRSALFNTEKLKKLQAKRMMKWRGNLAKSPLYNPLREKDPEEFPLIDKSIFMEQFDQINTVEITKQEAFHVAIKSEETRDFSPLIREISVGLSSGTSGNKGVFLANTRDRAIWVAAILDRVIGFSFKRRKVAFFLRANNNLYESVKSKLIQFVFFDLKTDLNAHIAHLHQLSPEILVAQPSVLWEIAKTYEINSLRASFNKVISVAEVLEDDQKLYLESIFKCRVEQVYQCTEGFLAHTCSKGNLHFNEDWLIIEKKYLDEEQKRFHPIITDLLRFTQPVVRYELNDIIHEAEPCACGMVLLPIKKIEGRSDDVFILENTEGASIKIFPDFIRGAIIKSSHQIVNYVVTQKSKNSVSLYLEVAGDGIDLVYAQAEEALTGLFYQYRIQSVALEREYNRLTDKSLKFKRIVNESSKAI